MATIFYGILGEGVVRRNIDKWVGIAGKPDAFCEKDENLEKFQEKLLGRYDVVSLDEALKRYPDADVWVTYPKPSATAKKLLKILPSEKIHFLEADLEYRKGCRFLGNFISYRRTNFAPCCVTGQAPKYKNAGSVSQKLSHWQDVTEKLVDDVRNDRPNACEKCHLLKHGFYRKSVKLNEINFGTNNRGDICNFRCIYCFCAPGFEKLKNEEGLTTYEIIKEMSEMPEFNREDFVLQLANGEFCANKHCEDMLDIFLSNKWKFKLITNLSLYREKLATLMDSGRVISTLISLDAGTRETFKKVKQNDRFDIVVQNLKRYPLNKAGLQLKYIFLEGINDNETDVNGFYEIAKEHNAIIVFSSNLTKVWTDKMRESALGVIKKAKKDGVKISYSGSYLNAVDVKFVRDNYENADSSCGV